MKNTLNPKESAFRFPISIVFSFFKRSLHNGREQNLNPLLANLLDERGEVWSHPFDAGVVVKPLHQCSVEGQCQSPCLITVYQEFG